MHRTIFTQHADCQATVENASRHAWTLAIHNHKHIDENIKEVDVLRPAKDAAFLVLISKSSETLASMVNTSPNVSSSSHRNMIFASVGCVNMLRLV